MNEDGSTTSAGSREKDLRVVRATESIRLRPAMYIGDTSPRGLHHVALELVNRGVEEFIQGHASRVALHVAGDGRLTYEDDGRGVSTTPIAALGGRSQLEVALTEIVAGGRLRPGSRFLPTRGHHDLSLVVLSALSRTLDVEVWDDGECWGLGIERGGISTPLHRRGSATGHGVRFSFLPDSEIFRITEFDRPRLRQRLRELAFLAPGLRVELNDERVAARDAYHFPGGLSDYVRELSRNDLRTYKDAFAFSHEGEHCRVDAAFRHVERGGERILSYVNTYETDYGGTHVKGFRRGLRQAVAAFGRSHDWLPPGPAATKGALEGLTAGISVWVADPQFEGPTKLRLGGAEVERLVASITDRQLRRHFESRPAAAGQLVARALAFGGRARPGNHP